VRSINSTEPSGHVAVGRTVTLELMVPHDGKYDFYSTYHRTEGMTGTIIASR